MRTREGEKRRGRKESSTIVTCGLLFPLLFSPLLSDTPNISASETAEMSCRGYFLFQSNKIALFHCK